MEWCGLMATLVIACLAGDRLGVGVPCTCGPRTIPHCQLPAAAAGQHSTLQIPFQLPSWIRSGQALNVCGVAVRVRVGFGAAQPLPARGP